jgi:hypothetical protein
LVATETPPKQAKARIDEVRVTGAINERRIIMNTKKTSKENG